MSSADVRDMLDLPNDGHPKPAKKQKTVEKRPEGITRELFALLGERAPPVAMTEHIRFKAKPKWSHKVAQAWEMASFINPARDDGLLLRHWSKRKESNQSTSPATPAESNGVVDMEQDVKAENVEPDYHFAKFNVKVEKPEYTDAQYETHLKSADWDKSETDYLVELVHEWDLRWVVIADRYEYQPGDSESQESTIMAAHVQPKERSMEDMKSRYYQVAAKIMALHHPLSQMSAAEFDIHQKMTKFDPVTELKRKNLAQSLLSRTAEEIQEEELLLGEVKRITSYQQRFSQERKELYHRLDYPISTSGSSAPLSSDDLNQLWKNLVNADKSKKHRILSESLANASSTNSSQPPPTQTERNPRNSVSGPADKRQSISGTPTYRQLSAREEAKYGVSHHDRVAGGVQFRHERVVKLSQAKSNAQATKIGAALVELNIPPRLFMPTVKVVSQYERLINNIQTLIECKKVTDKAEHEIKVLTTQREELERRKQEGSKSDGLVQESGHEARLAPEQGTEGQEENGPENGADIQPDNNDKGDKVGQATQTRPKLDDEGDEQEENSGNMEVDDEEDEEGPNEDNEDEEEEEEAEEVAEGEEEEEEEEEEDEEEEVEEEDVEAAEKSDDDHDASEDENDDGDGECEGDGGDNENDNEDDNDEDDENDHDENEIDGHSIQK